MSSLKPDVSAALVFAGSVLFWGIAYLFVIYRGFKDRTNGIPMPAVMVNLSWEATYAFLYRPFSDIGHVLTIPWFCIDLVIASQCLRYGGNDAAEPFLRKNSRLLFVVGLALVFPAMYMSFHEFNDWYGEYTAVFDNSLMSVLFIALLIRRGGVGGQSMYIAVLKWLGTFLGWMATSLTVNTSARHPWPSSPVSFVAKTFGHTAYPLTPLINYLYAVIFVIDIVYILMLRARLRQCGVSLWRRI